MSEILKKPGAVFFDWDGTLVDSFALLHDAHNHTRVQLGLEPFDVEAFRGYFGQPREKLYTEIYGVDNIDAAKAHFESYIVANHIGGLKPMEGAIEVLETLQMLGVPCGVVTNKKRSLVDAEIKNYGWDDFFVSVVGAAEAEADKPSAAPLKLAVERSGLKLTPDQIWFVGDTDNDLECAAGYRCVSVFIGPDQEVPELLEKFNIHLHKNNCTALSRFLLQYK